MALIIGTTIIMIVTYCWASIMTAEMESRKLTESDIREMNEGWPYLCSCIIITLIWAVSIGIQIGRNMCPWN